MQVKQITRRKALPFITDLHYAQRVPSISWAYGLYSSGSLLGVVTFGKPASNSLCVGVCGQGLSSKVYELNRLILLPDAPLNSASVLIGGGH